MDAVSHKNIIENSPKTLNMMRMHRECTIAPMKSNRQNIANIPAIKEINIIAADHSAFGALAP